MAALMVRYLQSGEWTQDRPVNEEYKVMAKRDTQKKQSLKQMRNLAEVEYAYHNPNNFRQENLATIRELSKDPLFQCVKNKFSCYLNAPPKPPLGKTCYTPQVQSNQSCPGPLDEATKSSLWDSCFNAHEQTLKITAAIDQLEGLLENKGKKKKWFQKIWPLNSSSGGKNQKEDIIIREQANKVTNLLMEDKEKINNVNVLHRFCQVIAPYTRIFSQTVKSNCPIKY